jgi:hypothetical protein
VKVSLARDAQKDTQKSKKVGNRKPTISMFSKTEQKLPRSARMTEKSKAGLKVKRMKSNESSLLRTQSGTAESRLIKVERAILPKTAQNSARQLVGTRDVIKFGVLASDSLRKKKENEQLKEKVRTMFRQNSQRTLKSKPSLRSPKVTDCGK